MAVEPWRLAQTGVIPQVLQAMVRTQKPPSSNIYYRTEKVSVQECVTTNVKIDETNSISPLSADSYSVLKTLYCRGCDNAIGGFYTATTRALDYKLEKFSLKKSMLTSYSFANTAKQRGRKKKRHADVDGMEKQLKKIRFMHGQFMKTLSELEKKIAQSE
ncbi:protein Mis18-alpha-like [Anomaloglossus baeobatrachus]|uniref:protein Mis18-alpha-like n=1 Tax=Anomaloglossus baeobatrachus TaxID=238106 RepID=UPI003F4FDEAF